MENNLVRLKLRQRLNKLASNDFTNLECWQETELLNKAQLQIIRRNLHGGNLYKEGDEQSVIRIDDFQILLTEKILRGTLTDHFFETEPIPDNYLKFKRISVTARTKDCKTPRHLRVSLVEEANVDELLGDDLLKPSFKWAETFCTIIGNRVRIYLEKGVSIDNCTLTYYRFPKEIAFDGCRDINDQVQTPQELEFKNDLVELIIDEAVKIASADINDFNNYSRISQNIETNN